MRRNGTEVCLWQHFFHTVDQSILLWLQDAIRCPALSALLVPLTIVGEGGIIWILISAVMLFFPQDQEDRLDGTGGHAAVLPAQ